MLIIGFDPGLATGIAVYDTDAQTLDMELTGEYTVDGVYAFLRDNCGPHMRQVEFFRISARTIKTQVDYSAIHLIGSIKFAAFLCGGQVLFSDPGDAKAPFPDAALKQAGWWHTSGHARDALRHLALRCVREGHVDAKIFLLP